MNEVFLEIPVNKLLLTNLKEYQLPVPVSKDNEILAIIFDTEEDYCKCLSEIEKVSTNFLSEYWLSKTPELIEKNRCVNRILTILDNARTKKYPKFDQW